MEQTDKEKRKGNIVVRLDTRRKEGEKVNKL